MGVPRNRLGNPVDLSCDNATIGLSVTPQVGSVVIAALVQGMGVPKKKFEAIFQSSKKKNGAAGRGLGLSNSRDIVAAHKASISDKK